MSQFFPRGLPLSHPIPCSHRPSPPHCPCPWVIQTCSLTTPFPFFPPFPSPLFLWQLSVCSLFPCLWFCFTLIDFHGMIWWIVLNCCIHSKLFLSLTSKCSSDINVGWYFPLCQLVRRKCNNQKHYVGMFVHDVSDCLADMIIAFE